MKYLFGIRYSSSSRIKHISHFQNILRSLFDIQICYKPTKLFDKVLSKIILLHTMGLRAAVKVPKGMEVAPAN